MSKLIRLRACKRCGGDLTQERDSYGAYIECIQCGAVWNQPEPERPRREAVSAPQDIRANEPAAAVR